MLEQYVNIHFKTEEALMAEAGYPAFDEHKILHKGLIRETKGISSESVLDINLDTVLKFLREWWLGHINKEDRKYAPYIKKLLETE